MKRGNVQLYSLTIVGVLMLSIILAPLGTGQNPVDEIKGTPAGWSDDINLSDDPVNRDSYSALAINNDEIHLVWEHVNLTMSETDILYTKSTDNGVSWESIQSLAHNTSYLGDVEIGLHDNNIHVVWENNAGLDGIYYRNSTDDGASWNPTKRISPDSTNAGNPSVFVNNSNVHIIWHNHSAGPGGQIYYKRSLDGGITFDNGQGVDEDRRITFSPSTVSSVNMAGYGSNISVIWDDERDGDWEVYWMISKDNGYTWENGLGSEHVGRKISDSPNNCGDPAIAMYGLNISIVWYEQIWPGPFYSLYYRNSTDMGVTWGDIQLLQGPYPALFDPEIKIDENNVHVVWTEGHIDSNPHYVIYKNSTNGGITWSENLTLTYNSLNETSTPNIGVHNNEKHVFWHNRFDSNKRDVFYKRYPDFPDLYPPDHSNELPQPDSYRDAPGTNVSVHVTDPSGVNESTIQLWINGSLVSHTSTSITDGFNVSYESPGFEQGVVECRIVADDNLTNHLDFTWNFTVLSLYEIQLHEGWNLISVPHVQVDTSISEVLRDIDGKWDYIQWYDAGSGEWKSYTTFWPESLNDLHDINNTMAFWINITEPNVNLTVRGHISTYTEIQLQAGWNLVGYSTQNTETVANSLWGTGADKVEAFDPAEPYRIKEVGPTYIMKPGEGYWVHVPANTVWVVDW